MIKKTYNINLAGIQFVIDDDAYTLANNYLDAIEHLVRDPEEREELTTDIETRMAELLSVKLEESGNTIITLQMVEEVIARIGQPNDFIEVEEEVVTDSEGRPETEEVKVEVTGATPPPIPGARRGSKRLFRDTQNSVIAGVCSGIAHYFKIDPVWIRLVFVLLALGLLDITSMMTMVFIYIVLWIVIPPADTPLKRMEMYGEEPTLGNLAKTVTAENDPQGAQGDNRGLAGFLSKAGHGLMLFFGAVSIPVAFALCIAILGCLFVMIMYWSGLSFGRDLFDAGFTRETIWGVACGLSVCVTLLIPALFLIWYLVRAIKPNVRLSRATEITLAVIWIIAFIFSAVCCAILGMDIPL